MIDNKKIPSFELDSKTKRHPPTKSEWIPDSCSGDEILYGECNKVKK